MKIPIGRSAACSTGLELFPEVVELVLCGVERDSILPLRVASSFMTLSHSSLKINVAPGMLSLIHI